MPTPSIAERLRGLVASTPPFDQLGPDVLDELARDLTVVQFDAGSIILAQGSNQHRGLFLIESGAVQIKDTGRARLIRRCTTGDVFGVFGLIKGGLIPYEAKAVAPTTCAILPSGQFQTLYKAHPALAIYFDRDAQQFMQRLDRYVDVGGAHLLFSRRLGDLPLRPLLTGVPDLSVQEVARRMTEHRHEAFVVQRDDGLTLGLVTDRSLRTIVAEGLPPDTPASKAMRSPVVSLPATASLFDAVLAMVEHNTESVIVQPEEHEEDEPGPARLLTATEVAHFRGKDPLATLRHIDHGTTLASLASIRTEAHEMFQGFYEQQTSPEFLGLLMTSVYDRLVRRVLHLVEHHLRESAPADAVDLPWCWLRLGSSGRREAGLVTEQHNALVYADPADEEEQRRAAAWFQRLATAACDALERSGFAVSRLVARDARYCKSLSAWQQQLQHDINTANEATLTDLLLTLDLRPLLGDLRMADTLRQSITDTLSVSSNASDSPFFRQSGRHLASHRVPQSIFDRLKQLRPDAALDVNVYLRGVAPVVHAARLLALELGYLSETSTHARLRHAISALPEHRPLLRSVAVAYEYVLDLRLQHQLTLAEGGDRITEEIDIAGMAKIDRQALQRALRTIAEFQELVTRRYS